ncbi:PaaX family transcriptional regulator C-terminal domain-containing protein [Metabacillus litoralis]|uniref:PaaX family transcriptional regulator C-terminal domain-containing protein n=1 Tax=Metabacillus litoralis TaxID=152268 RepID=UPI000EF6005D|nr:PaaX family transcriptional regulator C-terminal domain-containing protein [Metabacillus litoralis]
MTVEKQILYLLSKVEQLEGKKIISIYEERNYTSQSIRNMLSKLKKEKFITSPQRSVYAITTYGRDFITTIERTENFYQHRWNNKWYMILTEIPETERKKRDAFRRQLIQLGFGQLYNSVYIYPWNLTNKVLNMIDTLEIEEYVTILVSDEFLLNKVHNQGAKGPNEAARIWDLERIHNIYIEKLDWIKNEYEPKLHPYLKGNLQDPLKLFIFYLEIQEVLDVLLEEDPMLPPEFLPTSWLGTRALAHITKIQASLVNLIPNDSFYYQFLTSIHDNDK